MKKGGAYAAQGFTQRPATRESGWAKRAGRRPSRTAACRSWDTSAKGGKCTGSPAEGEEALQPSAVSIGRYSLDTAEKSRFLFFCITPNRQSVQPVWVPRRRALPARRGKLLWPGRKLGSLFRSFLDSSGISGGSALRRRKPHDDRQQFAQYR